MSADSNSVRKPFSGLFTALSVVLFLGGFYLIGSSALATKAWYFRLFVVLVCLAVSLGLLFVTEHWLKIKDLALGARIEIRKVIWPKKDELVKTTLMVLAIVAVFSIFLTLIDGILTIIIQWVL